MATAVIVTAAVPRRRSAWPGRALFAATTLAIAVALALALTAGGYSTLVYAGVDEALAVIGVLLTTRRPAHPVSWLIAGAALVSAVFVLAHAYAVQALVTDPGSLPAGLVAAWLDGWGWLPGLVVLPCALLLLMPDGHLRSSRWWPAAASLVLGTILAAAAVSSQATFDLGGPAPIDNPLAHQGVAAAAAGLVGAFLLLAAVSASLASFGVRFRSSVGEERQQLRWVGLSLAVAVMLGVVGIFLWGVVPGAGVLPAVASLVLPAGIAVAILRYRLFELDLVVNRAAVYAVLTGVVVIAYVAAVGLIGTVLSPTGDLVASLVVTGIVAVSFQPLRERVQRLVNRLMYGERDDPYAAIARLGRSLTSAVQLTAVLPTVVETLGQTLALRYVALVVEAEVVAEYGAPAGESLVVPLVHQGVAVGELRLAGRQGEQLRQRDERLIADLAPQVAAAVHAVELSNELQAARQHIVELREEERRRIRRDLHDGLGPALAGLTFTLEAVRNLTTSDLRRADALLVSATAQVQAMIGDVRRLIYGLRPPALDQLGLAASIRGLAAQESWPQTVVTVSAPPSLQPLPAAVEVAAYWIVQEALTNAKRHARARTCAVRLIVRPGALLLEIADDGRGLGTGSEGIGLQTMKERAAEIGGTCEITSRPGGGTTVSATLPVLGSEIGVQ